MYAVANTYVKLGTTPYHEGQLKNDLDFIKTENGWNIPTLFGLVNRKWKKWENTQ
jgi:hypothetical protein